VTTVWELELMGCPCTIQAVDGDWVVVFASSLARSSDLAKAIELASGGLIGSSEAKAVAKTVQTTRAA
jgi:hypothetical protein